MQKDNDKIGSTVRIIPPPKSQMSEEDKAVYDSSNKFPRKFKWGKYKGETIRKVILTDVQYVRWCMKNVPWMKFTSEEKALTDEVEHKLIVERSKIKNYLKKQQSDGNAYLRRAD